MKPVRSRYAPSPTGYMHIGNLRSALYEYLIAKHAGGTFILRIEDTDQSRFVEGATEVILDSLKIMGLDFDEGPIFQSHRKAIYLPYAKELVDKGAAYYCFCSKDEAGDAPEKYNRHCYKLPKSEIEARLAAGTPFVIRQLIPEGKSSFHDEVFGDIAIDHKEIEDQVLIKSDGMPTYNFANVIDDHEMEITHVVRGSEYLTSTPKYNLLYEAFGWERPIYVHLPLMTNSEGKKISKRRDTYAAVQYLMDEGYLPSAILNYVAFLGWSSPDNREYFTLPELVEAFEIKNISRSPSIFDLQKLAWMNGEHIKRLPEDEFYEMALATIEGAIKTPGIDLHHVARMVQSRILFIREIPELVDFIDQLQDYDVEMYTHKKMKSDPEIALQALSAILPVYQAADKWDNDSLYTAALECAKGLGLKNSQILWPIRTALSGKPSSPCGASELCVLLGKNESLRRLETGIAKLNVLN